MMPFLCHKVSKKFYHDKYEKVVEGKTGSGLLDPQDLGIDQKYFVLLVGVYDVIKKSVQNLTAQKISRRNASISKQC